MHIHSSAHARIETPNAGLSPFTTSTGATVWVLDQAHDPRTRAAIEIWTAAAEAHPHAPSSGPTNSR